MIFKNFILLLKIFNLVSIRILNLSERVNLMNVFLYLENINFNL